MGSKATRKGTTLRYREMPLLNARWTYAVDTAPFGSLPMPPLLTCHSNLSAFASRVCMSLRSLNPDEVRVAPPCGQSIKDRMQDDQAAAGP